MRFDKSLKILNYAKNVGGFLELYTELDHSFLQGDKIFIVGGIYDNTENLSYISSFNIAVPNSYNPFKSYKTGYVIKSVNYANNSFIINYPVSSILYYPCGVIGNEFGNPLDLINLAYNTYTGNNIDKGIFVSRASLINGNFRKGTINNGIVGNDYHKVRLNIHENQIASAVTADITINHIISKNLSLSKGAIFSKTDSNNPATIKLSVVEDFTLGTLINPFGVLSIITQPNNDSFGYSVYEKIKNYDTLTINNGYFHNSKANNIDISNVTLIKGKIGDKYPIEIDANKFTDCNLNDGILNNFTNNQVAPQIFSFGGTVMDTFIDLKPTSVVWGGSAGTIIMYVDYNTIANKNWPVGVVNGHCYFSGISPRNVDLSNSDQFLITQSTGYVVSVSYTFGVQNSAQIRLYFDNLVSNWATFIATYTPANFDFTKAKLCLYGYEKFKVNGNVSSTTISTYTVSGSNVYFDSTVNSITVVEGYYKNITYHANTAFIGKSYGESILLEGPKQMFQSNVTGIKKYEYVKIINAVIPIKGDFFMSNIMKATIHNSNLNSCLIDPVLASDIFLHNINITGTTKISNSIKWDQVIFNGLPDTIIPSPNTGTDAILIVNSYLGQRKTPWKTGPGSIAPLAITTKSIEYNKIQQTRSLLEYNSQAIVQNIPILYNIPKTSITYQIPSLETVQSPVDYTKFMSIIDHGGMQLYTIHIGFFYLTFWSENAGRVKNDVLFSGVLNTDVLLNTAIDNRTTANLSGTINPLFIGVDPLLAALPDIREVDDNFIYIKNNYFNAAYAREITDITINVWDNPPIVATQPDPAYTLAFLSFLKVTNLAAVSTDNIMPGSTTTLPLDSYKISFRNFGPSVEQCILLPTPTCYPILATNVPACFIEIERVIVTGYYNTNKKSFIKIYNTNFCPPIPGYATGGVEYSWDTLVPGSSYPTDFVIQGPGITQIGFKIDTGSYHHVDVEVEYWITWYAVTNQAPTNDNLQYTGYDMTGKREKRVDTYYFN